jgi:hypothetical protein
LRPEERALFDVYLMMLDDASLGSEITTVIKTGQWAQGALRQVVTEHVNRFELMDDAYLRERASDVKDLGRRLLAYLQEERQQNLVYPEKPSGQRRTDAGDARRGAGRHAGRSGVGAWFGQLPRRDPGPGHGHSDGHGPGRPAVRQGRRHRSDRRWHTGEVHTNPSEGCASSSPRWSKKRNNWRWASIPCATCA